MFTVGSEKEAEALVRLACPRDLNGAYYARELASEQTLENLEAFSAKLDRAHDLMIERGNCRCKKKTAKALKKGKKR